MSGFWNLKRSERTSLPSRHCFWSFRAPSLRILPVSHLEKSIYVHFATFFHPIWSSVEKINRGLVRETSFSRNLIPLPSSALPLSGEKEVQDLRRTEPASRMDRAIVNWINDKRNKQTKRETQCGERGTTWENQTRQRVSQAINRTNGLVEGLTDRQTDWNWPTN